MKKRIRVVACGLILAAAAGAAFAASQSSPGRTPLYYKAPDGKPFYAAGPKQGPDGRAYVPVYSDGSASAKAPSKSMAQPPAEADAAPKPAQRILYYRAPMGPDTSPAPKKDSMGMAYLPVYADENTSGDPPGTVRISPGRIQTLGVRTQTVETRPALSRTVRATGIVQFDERHLATVTTRADGWVTHLAVAATGDAVKRGEVLAEIYAPNLAASEQEYLIAKNLGGGLAAAATERLRALGVPDQEIERLRRTGQAATTIPVVAPADGVVIDKPAQEGVHVAPGDPLYRTADLSDVWLIAEVQEQDLGKVHPGQHATASFVAFPGRGFAGTVDFIYPSLSKQTRTARVRIVLPNPDSALRAAMYATVEIQAPAAPGSMVAVPESAVIDSGTRQIVLVALGDGRFAPRSVRLGAHGSDWVQVLAGVKPGEQVVVGANFLIDAESNLRTALQSFAASDASADGKAP